MAAVQQTNLFSDDSLQEYNVENSLLEFLEFVLERTVELSEQVACGNDTRSMIVLRAFWRFWIILSRC